MYNHTMTIHSYEIRICTSCGLRYPLSAGNSFGIRCPICMGETRLVLSRELVTEPARYLPFDSDPLKPVKAALLDNIRSALNVGSILRSADGFGYRHVHLCGITPTPENETVTKTSLGAEDSVPWSYHKDAVKLVRGLRKEGWLIVGLEEEERAISIQDEGAWKRKEDLGRNVVLMVGNEVTGIDPELLDLCDHILCIPMLGEKKSFNVAVAFGIAAYAMHD
jgi:23S rRNA (guanosine2251-2'-O)-methyltransferase